MPCRSAVVCHEGTSIPESLDVYGNRASLLGTPVIADWRSNFRGSGMLGHFLPSGLSSCLNHHLLATHLLSSEGF